MFRVIQSGTERRTGRGRGHSSGSRDLTPNTHQGGFRHNRDLSKRSCWPSSRMYDLYASDFQRPNCLIIGSVIRFLAASVVAPIRRLWVEYPSPRCVFISPAMSRRCKSRPFSQTNSGPLVFRVRCRSPTRAATGHRSQLSCGKLIAPFQPVFVVCKERATWSP